MATIFFGDYMIDGAKYDKFSKIRQLTRAEFDAIANKDPDTLYVITDESGKGDSSSYTKEQILSDETKILYGLETSAVPNNVFSKISEKLDAKQNSLTGTAGQVVGFDADGKPVAQDAPSSGIEMVLLWENASPNSDFSPQTINIDLSNYDAVEIESKNITVGAIYRIDKIRKGTIGCLNRTDKAITFRECEITETGVIFNNAVAFAQYNGSQMIGNNIVIPIKIYGIKEVTST